MTKQSIICYLYHLALSKMHHENICSHEFGTRIVINEKQKPYALLSAFYIRISTSLHIHNYNFNDCIYEYLKHRKIRESHLYHDNSIINLVIDLKNGL